MIGIKSQGVITLDNITITHIMNSMDKQKQLTKLYEDEQELRARLSVLRLKRIEIMRDLRVEGFSYQSIGQMYGKSTKQYIISLVKTPTYQPE